MFRPITIIGTIGSVGIITNRAETINGTAMTLERLLPQMNSINVRLILLLIVAIILTTTIPACTTGQQLRIETEISGKETKGRVLNAENDLPIENVIVLALWMRYYPQLFNSYVKCTHAASTQTNQNGYWQIPEESTWARTKWDKSRTFMNFFIFKPGYKAPDFEHGFMLKKGNIWEHVFPKRYYVLLYNSDKWVDVDNLDSAKRMVGFGNSYLVPAIAPNIEELTSLVNSSRCNAEDGSGIALLPFYEAIYKEAAKLTQSDAQPAVANIQNSYERLALGDDEADRRLKERLAPNERKSRLAQRAIKSVGIADLQFVVQTGLADPNAVLDNGYTLLTNAVFSGDADKVAYLLQSGADPTSVNKSSGGTALHMAIEKLFNGNIENRAGYIDIVKMLSVAKGADITSLRTLSSSSDPEIRALADAGRRTNSASSNSTGPIGPMDIFSKAIALTPGEVTYLQFTIKNGRIRSVRQSAELPRTGEILSLRLRDRAKTGQRSVNLRTHMHGKIYMRVVLEGGDRCTQPIQNYLVGTPPYDRIDSWTLEADCKQVTVTDFSLQNWPNEPPEQSSVSIDVGTRRPVDSKASAVRPNRTGSESFGHTK